MNKLCNICDTKNRLNMCKGREGDFKYCYRKCGSLYGLEESIQPFNDLKELEKNECLEYVDILEQKPYSENIDILLGKHKQDISGLVYPVGYIITDNDNK